MSKGPLIYDTSITIRVTPDQKAEISLAATKVGDVLSRFARKAALKETRRILKAA